MGIFRSRILRAQMNDLGFWATAYLYYKLHFSTKHHNTKVVVCKYAPTNQPFVKYLFYLDFLRGGDPRTVLW